jgi:hypothetical protein
VVKSLKDIQDQDWSIHVGKGWGPIVSEAVTKIHAAGGLISQVKEKFGGLRIYTYQNTDEVEATVAAACEKARVTCEYCGKPGTIHQLSGWYKTVCEDCKEK